MTRGAEGLSQTLTRAPPLSRFLFPRLVFFQPHFHSPSSSHGRADLRPIPSGNAPAGAQGQAPPFRPFRLLLRRRPPPLPPPPPPPRPPAPCPGSRGPRPSPAPDLSPGPPGPALGGGQGRHRGQEEVLAQQRALAQGVGGERPLVREEVRDRTGGGGAGGGGGEKSSKPVILVLVLVLVLVPGRNGIRRGVSPRGSRAMHGPGQKEAFV